MFKLQFNTTAKITQVGLSYFFCQQTLKYSEKHRSGGHFDVEINQASSAAFQRNISSGRYKKAMTKKAQIGDKATF